MRPLVVSHPQELLEAPELALLNILNATLEQMTFALFAVHPELASGDSLEGCRTTSCELWVADAIQTNIAALQHLLERYKQVLERARNLHWADRDIV
jgi:hypothetical protein